MAESSEHRRYLNILVNWTRTNFNKSDLVNLCIDDDSTTKPPEKFQHRRPDLSCESLNRDLLIIGEAKSSKHTFEDSHDQIKQFIKGLRYRIRFAHLDGIKLKVFFILALPDEQVNSAVIFLRIQRNNKKNIQVKNLTCFKIFTGRGREIEVKDA